MTCKHILCLFAVLLFLVSVATIQSGCASIVPPTGGPRDSLPPVLVQVNPADSTLNFKGDRIVLNFNEYVQIDDVQKNLLVSPVPKVIPTVQVKLRTISIKINDTLEENTTYSLDFGKAIKDLNEGNILRGFKYLFSTGSRLDSLSLGGRVLMAETGKPDSTLIVMLHTSMFDSAVAKDRPRYIARLDSSGNFRFHNLAAGTYAVYALKDEGGMRRYAGKDQVFAFADSAVTSESQKQDIMLYAFAALDTATASKSTTRPPAVAAKAPARKNDEMADRLLKISANLSNGQLDLLSNLVLSIYPDPVGEFDSTKLILTDESFKPLRNYTAALDSTRHKLTITYAWQENTKYNLLLDTAFAADTIGRKLLRNDTLAFQTKKTSDYGLVRLRFPNLPLDRHPLLLFIQNNEIKQKHVFTNNQFYAKLFPPGEYELRIVYDENQNGEWDTGQFFGKRVQPEKVHPILKKINVRANWDTEMDIQL